MYVMSGHFRHDYKIYNNNTYIYNAHISQGRGPESEAWGAPAWKDGVKEKLKRSKRI